MRLIVTLALAGLAIAPAVAAEDRIPCRTIKDDGTWTFAANNYDVTASEALFLYPIAIEAKGEGISLVAVPELGGTGTFGQALLRGRLLRGADGVARVDVMEFEWPVTSFTDASGVARPVVALAYEQGVPVGISLAMGGTPLGDIRFDSGGMPAESRVLQLTAEASATVYEARMTGGRLTGDLVVGGISYSQLWLVEGYWPEFHVQLTGLMDKMAGLEAGGGCSLVMSGNPASDDVDDY